MSSSVADVWVVAGPPGSGKTTVANILLAHLQPTPALLDKDTLYGPFVTALLNAAGSPAGEREGAWYDAHIKKYEYAGITATAREIRSKGCPVVLSGPFTQQIHDPALWKEWVEQLGGEHVKLVWVQTDAATIRKHLVARGSGRDSEKLEHFAEFITYMQPGVPPVVPHIAIDNRAFAPANLEAQVATLIFGE